MRTCLSQKGPNHAPPEWYSEKTRYRESTFQNRCSCQWCWSHRCFAKRHWPILPTWCCSLQGWSSSNNQKWSQLQKPNDMSEFSPRGKRPEDLQYWKVYVNEEPTVVVDLEVSEGLQDDTSWTQFWLHIMSTTETSVIWVPTTGVGAPKSVVKVVDANVEVDVEIGVNAVVKSFQNL